MFLDLYQGNSFSQKATKTLVNAKKKLSYLYSMTMIMLAWWLAWCSWRPWRNIRSKSSTILVNPPYVDHILAFLLASSTSTVDLIPNKRLHLIGSCCCEDPPSAIFVISHTRLSHTRLDLYARELGLQCVVYERGAVVKDFWDHF